MTVAIDRIVLIMKPSFLHFTFEIPIQKDCAQAKGDVLRRDTFVSPIPDTLRTSLSSELCSR
jgi:hypothetical protein